MEPEKFDLFIFLLKLKSFLVGIIDSPEDCETDFQYTEEFLERKLPERKDEIIEMLRSNNIEGDCDMVFNEKIHFKFREITQSDEKNINLESVLNKLDIKTHHLVSDANIISNYQKLREEKLNSILTLLFELVKGWAEHKEIENQFDNYAILDEEEMIRPEEEKKLLTLDKKTLHSFRLISSNSEKYIDQMIDYYFNYGGNQNLDEFVEDIKKIGEVLRNKYVELFRKNGFDNEIS